MLKGLSLYTIIAFDVEQVVVQLDNYQTNSIDFEKLKRSINIPRNPKKRCKTYETNEFTQMVYPGKPNGFSIFFNVNGYVELSIPVTNDIVNNIKSVEQMLSHFKK